MVYNKKNLCDSLQNVWHIKTVKGVKLFFQPVYIAQLQNQEQRILVLYLVTYQDSEVRMIIHSVMYWSKFVDKYSWCLFILLWYISKCHQYCK